MYATGARVQEYEEIAYFYFAGSQPCVNWLGHPPCWMDLRGHMHREHYITRATQRCFFLKIWYDSRCLET